ncbi:hypothetical protein ABZ746_20040 [Streptomyces sp. NPDC020096]
MAHLVSCPAGKAVGGHDKGKVVGGFNGDKKGAKCATPHRADRPALALGRNKRR